MIDRRSGSDRTVLLKNAEIFDALSDRARPGHVLIEGPVIAAVESSPIAETDRTTVIDCAGRVLMPGMIDAHVHLVAMANTLIGLALASRSELAGLGTDLLFEPRTTRGKAR